MTVRLPDDLPRVSAVVPVWNEARHIEGCITRLLEQTYPADRMEILVVDGLSADGTREAVGRLAAATSVPARPGGAAPRLRLIDAPKRQRAAALNAGIQEACSDMIVRVDARTVIPRDYVERCVRTLLETGADNVGGIQKPIATGIVQEAIGLAMSHPFGVGNAQFRIGKKSGFVDKVYLGCFRRGVFDRIGLFDEESPIISEDSDINQRIREGGGRVYLDTGIFVHYYPRETLTDLWKLYFRYGGARAGNLLKHGNLTSWRQAVPAVFVASLGIFVALSPVSRWAFLALGGLLALYAACDLGISGYLSMTTRRWRIWPWLCAVFPCIHVGWAFGFFRRLSEWRRPQPSSWASTER